MNLMAQFDSATVNSTVREILLASCGVPQEEEAPIVTGLWADDFLLNGRLVPMPSLDEATQLTSMAVDQASSGGSGDSEGSSDSGEVESGPELGRFSEEPCEPGSRCERPECSVGRRDGRRGARKEWIGPR